MECKKCGCDTFIKKDDWYECASCGAITFDTSITINDVTSPTKAIEKIDSEGPIIQEEPIEETIQEDKANEPSENSEKKDKKKSKEKKNSNEEKPSRLKEIVDFLLPIFIAMIVALLLKTFIFANCVVPTGSMLNTIQEGDRLIASRIAYVSDEPQRYDIILFHYPDDESTIYVKRIIGLPGEKVEVVDGVVYVTQEDGKTIQLDDSFVTTGKPVGDFGPYYVPEDSYFMMGDNRGNSWDSRYWDNKYVHKSKILGKVKFRYYPNFSAVE